MGELAELCRPAGRAVGPEQGASRVGQGIFFVEVEFLAFLAARGAQKGAKTSKKPKNVYFLNRPKAIFL